MRYPSKIYKIQSKQCEKLQKEKQHNLHIYIKSPENEPKQSLTATQGSEKYPKKDMKSFAPLLPKRSLI